MPLSSTHSAAQTKVAIVQVSVLTFDTTLHKMSGKGNPSFGSSLVAMNCSAQVNLGLAG
jgi:hypothetical protein